MAKHSGDITSLAARIFSASITFENRKYFNLFHRSLSLALALTGDTAWVDQMNRDPMFHWYQAIRGADGKNRAVLEIWGNDKESFRDYEAGAKAAARRR
jgi:hypothetical protein